MRQLVTIFTLYFIFLSSAIAQTNIFPNVLLETLDGKFVNSAKILSNDTVSIVVFWNPDFDRSLDQIDLMLQTIQDSLSAHPVKTIAIAVSEPGKSALIKPIVMSRFDGINCLFDKNRELVRHLGINEFPYTFLIDQEGKIICRRPGFCLGADVMLCKEIRQCMQKLK